MCGYRWEEMGYCKVLRAADRLVSLVVEALLVFYLTKGIINSFYRHKEIRLARFLHNRPFPPILLSWAFCTQLALLHILPNPAHSAFRPLPYQTFRYGKVRALICSYEYQPERGLFATILMLLYLTSIFFNAKLLIVQTRY